MCNSQTPPTEIEVAELLHALKGFGPLGGVLTRLAYQRDKQADEIELVRAERDELRRLVHPLPKCCRLNEAGVLVEDAPVTDGMVTYCGEKTPFAHEWAIRLRTGEKFKDHCRSHHERHYDSREAARASQELGTDETRIRKVEGSMTNEQREIEKGERVMATTKVRRCRVCGCTEDDCSGCIERTGEPCHWIAPDLCSECEAVTGPIYNVELIDSLPLNYGQTEGCSQAMPSRLDLRGIKDYRQGQRVVAGYEVLLNHWREQQKEIKRLREMIDQSADSKLLPDCEHLFYPNCAREVRQENDLCYCEHCPNPDSGEAEPSPPLPLMYSSCYASSEAAKATEKYKS